MVNTAKAYFLNFICDQLFHLNCKRRQVCMFMLWNADQFTSDLTAVYTMLTADIFPMTAN